MLPFNPRWLILLVVLALSGLLLWGFQLRGDRTTDRALMQGKKKPSSNPIEITGLSLQSYHLERLIATLHAEVFKVSTRKFGIFSIRPVREATFIHPKVEIFLPGTNPSSDLDLFPFFWQERSGAQAKPRLNLSPDIGLISRVTLNSLAIQVYKKESSAPSLTISAEHAMINLRREIHLEGFVIKDMVSNGSIKSRRAIWSSSQKNFVVPGGYLHATGGVETRGKGIKLDLEFKIAPLHPTRE